MRWFRRSSKREGVPLDPGRQEELVHDLRARFGHHIRVSYADQIAAMTPILGDDDGMCIAVRILRDVANEAHATVYARVSPHGFTVDRRNYRPLWRHVGPWLQSPLFGLACGFHPYAHVTAALAAIAADPQRCLRLAAPEPLLAQVFEVLDLSTAGWEFGRVPVDPDAARTVAHLIGTAQCLLGKISDPPPLPPPMRETMRRNNITPVIDPTTGEVVGGMNLGARMRESFLT